MIGIFTTEYNVNVQHTDNVIEVVNEPSNVINIVQNDTPIIRYGNTSLFANSGDFWSTNEKIAVGGFGEFYNSTYRPIFIFEDNIQKLELKGSANIIGNDIDEPFVIKNKNTEYLFKINNDELPVFKVHNINKTPVAGALLFKDGDLFFGTD